MIYESVAENKICCQKLLLAFVIVTSAVLLCDRTNYGLGQCKIHKAYQASNLITMINNRFGWHFKAPMWESFIPLI